MIPALTGTPPDDIGQTGDRLGLDVSTLREASWVTIAAVVVAGATGVAVFNLNRSTIVDALQPMYDVTGGFVQPTLLVNLVLLVVVVGGLILWFGQFRIWDVGLVRGDVWVGIGITAGTWALMQISGTVAVIIQGEALALDNSLVTLGLLPILGGFVAQVFGNALYEEIVYRAFLLPQFVKKFTRRSWSGSPRTTFLVALLTSQFVFALIHVPGRLAGGVSVVDLPLFLAAPFVLGVLFALVYYRTGNLFVTVGLHALVNDPVLLVNAGAIVLLPLLLVVLVILFAWPSLLTLGTRQDQGGDSQ